MGIEIVVKTFRRCLIEGIQDEETCEDNSVQSFPLRFPLLVEREQVVVLLQCTVSMHCFNALLQWVSGSAVKLYEAACCVLSKIS